MTQSARTRNNHRTEAASFRYVKRKLAPPEQKAQCTQRVVRDPCGRQPIWLGLSAEQTENRPRMATHLKVGPQKVARKSSQTHEITRARKLVRGRLADRLGAPARLALKLAV
jgi:hypothetical protein